MEMLYIKSGGGLPTAPKINHKMRNRALCYMQSVIDLRFAMRLKDGVIPSKLTEGG